MDNNSTILNSIRKVNVFPTVDIITDTFAINGVTYEADLNTSQIIECLQRRAKVYEVFADGTTAQITLSNIQDDLYEESKKEKEEALKLKHEYETFKKKEQEYLQKIKELEEDLADVSTEGMEALRKQLEEAKSKIEELNANIEALNTTVEEKDAKIEELNAKITELTATIAERDASIEQLTIDLSAKTSELTTTKETLQNTSDQLTTATAELGTTKGQLNNALAQNQTLNQQLTDKTAELDTTKEQLETAQSLIADLNEQIEDLNAELEDVKGQLETAKEMIDQLEEDKREIIANSYRKVVKDDIIFGIDTMGLKELDETAVTVPAENLLSNYVDKGFSYSIDDTNKLNLSASGDITDVNTKLAYLIKLKEACTEFAEDSNSDDEKIVKDADGNKYLLEYIDIGAELSGAMTVVNASFNDTNSNIADRLLLLATFTANH